MNAGFLCNFLPLDPTPSPKGLVGEQLGQSKANHTQASIRCTVTPEGTTYTYDAKTTFKLRISVLVEDRVAATQNAVTSSPAGALQLASRQQGNWLVQYVRSKAPKVKDFTNQRARFKGVVDKAVRATNRDKSRIRARVEHVFGVVKRLLIQRNSAAKIFGSMPSPLSLFSRPS
jgi:hypothetical protein